MSVTDARTVAGSGEGNAAPFSEREIVRLRALLEKQAIYENMVKYIRAMDRQDLDGIRDAYWPDATDDHGIVAGSVEALVETASAMQQPEVIKSASHLIGNTQIELDGPQAKVESAFLSVAVFANPDGGGDRDLINLGRYRDLYEKRGDEWKILRRTVIWDYCLDQASAANWPRILPPECKNFGAKYPDDLIYGDW